MDSFLAFLNNYKIIDFCIAGVGIFGIVLIFDRFKALYVERALPAGPCKTTRTKTRSPL